MKMENLKIAVTVVILLTGGLATALVGTPSVSSSEGHEGTIIDFGNMETVWTAVDLSGYVSARSVLEYACSCNGYALDFASDGTVTRIDDTVSDGQHNWGLWVIEKGSTEWKVLPAPYDGVILSDYTVSSWAYCNGDGTPAVAVDSTGRCIYGYGQADRTVSLSPSLTEMVATVGATKTLVGTDSYSDYPQEVVTMQRNGDISIVGDYTTPSYEDILRVDPDIVLCDGSQYNHIRMAEKLRSSDREAFVLYDGESLDTIIDNIFIIGKVLGYDIGASSKISAILDAADSMVSILGSSAAAVKSDTMIALSPDISPYVSGGSTYAADILGMMYGQNVFSDWDGWTHINSEKILERDPSVIIILTADYEATQAEYDDMVSSLSAEWKGTDAYKNGRIYLICGEAGEMAQRPGPRAAQLMELFGRILNPDVFDDISIPRYIGDNYRDFLTYTINLE